MNINIDNQIVESAKNISSKIEDKEIRKRAFALNIAASVAAEYLNENGVEAKTKLSLYKAPSFARSFELADIYAQDVRLDVRVTFNDENFCVPKIQEKYDAVPEAYVVVKLAKDLTSAKILGFVPAKELESVKTDSEYYCYDLSLLKPIEDLKEFVDSCEVEGHLYSKDDHEKIKELSASFIDDEISQSEKVYFIKHLIVCCACRETFCDLNEFDTIVAQLKNHEGLLNDATLSVLSGNKKEIESAASVIEDLDDSANDSTILPIPVPVPVVPVVPVILPDSDITSLFDIVDDSEAEPVVVREVEVEEVEEEAKQEEMPFLVEDDDMSSLLEEAQEEILEEEILEEKSEEVHETLEAEPEEEPEVSESLETEPEESPEAEPETDNSPELIEESMEDELEELESMESLEELEELHDEDLLFEHDDEVVQEVAKEEIKEEAEAEIAEVVAEEAEEEPAVEEDEPFDLGDLEALDELEEFEELDEIEEEKERDSLDRAEKKILEEEAVNEEVEIEDEAEEEPATEETDVEEDEHLELGDLEALDELEELEELEELDEIEEEKERDSLDRVEKKIPEEEAVNEEFEEVEEESETQEEPVVDIDEEFPELIELDDEVPDVQEPVELDYEDEEVQEESVDEIQDFIDEPEEKEEQQEDNSELQGLLDDDLLALLSDDDGEQTTAQEQIEEAIEQDYTDESQDEVDLIESDEAIGALFDNETNENEDSSIAMEMNEESDAKAKAGTAKRFVILAALLVVVAGGAGAAWFINSQKAAETNDTPLETANSDGELFNFQNKGSKEEAQGPAISQDINKSMANSFSDKPAAIAITKIAWQVNEKLAADPSVKEYLQTAGKNIQMNLQNDLAYASDVAFNNSIKISFEIAPDNTMKGMQILESSGSDKIDQAVETSIKNTLKYVKVPKLKDNNSDYFLTIVINF